MTTTQDTQNLAWTMLGEARPGNVAGMTAVGNTVLNRLAAGNYGSSITAVVMAPNAYAAWGIGSQAASQGNHPETRFPVGSPQYQAAYTLAQQLIAGQVPDNTGGAVNYRASGSSSQYNANKPGYVDIGGNTFQTVHPVGAGTQLIAQPVVGDDGTPNASTLDVYGSTYGWAGTDAPASTPATQQPAPSSPASALDAIAEAAPTPGSSNSGIGYVDAGNTPQPVPLAPLPTGPTPSINDVPTPAPSNALAPQAAPYPLPPPATVSASQADQLALSSVKQFLSGSNVDLSKVPEAQQVALMKAVPQLVAMQNDPKATLNYLQSSGLYSALISAVPSHAPGMGENIWAAANGVTLPSKIPNSIADWNLPTGTNATAAASAIQNALAEAQGARVAPVNPTGATDWAAPYTQAQQQPAPANALSSGNSNWADAYTSSPAAVSAGSSSTPPSSSGSNSLASWSQPYIDAGAGSSNNGNGNSLTSWAQPYISGTQPATSGADLTSLSVSPTVDVPKYITISKQIQVPADQPIASSSSNVVWDPDKAQYVLQQAPAAAATPKMVTKTVPTKVLNPAYKAPVAAPAPVLPPAPPPAPIGTPVQQFQAANAWATPSEAYNAVAAPAAAQAATPNPIFGAITGTNNPAPSSGYFGSHSTGSTSNGFGGAAPGGLAGN